jgi:hypothetical protein
MRPEFGLIPTANSYKLRALEFIVTYWAARQASPSYGEIGAALGVSREHARRLVQQLALEGRINHRPGTHRGIMPLTAREEALRVLRTEGFIIDEEALRLDTPVTNQELPRLPVLDDDPSSQTGSGDHGEAAS